MNDGTGVVQEVSNGIGTRKERSLHAALKEWYARPGDRTEVPMGRMVIDLVRDDILVEIQTRNFFAIAPKLLKLAENHPIRLVHPITLEKWIVHDEAPEKRRRSPRKGRIIDLFRELVRAPALAAHRGITLEVLLIREEEVRRNDGKGSWRRKGVSIADRRLLEVVERRDFVSAWDLLALLPADIAGQFTNKELAAGLRCPVSLAQQFSRCLVKAGCLSAVGKRGRELLYEVLPDPDEEE